MDHEQTELPATVGRPAKRQRLDSKATTDTSTDMSDDTSNLAKSPPSGKQTPYHANAQNLYYSTPSSSGTMPSSGIPGLTLINSGSPPPPLSANTTGDSRGSYLSSSLLSESKGIDITNANLKLGPSPSHHVLGVGQSATLAEVPSSSSETLHTTCTYEHPGSAACPMEIEELPRSGNTTHRASDVVNTASTAEQVGSSGGTNESEKPDEIARSTSPSTLNATDSKVRSGSEDHEWAFGQQHYNLAAELSDLIGIVHTPHDVPSDAPSLVVQQAPGVIKHQNPSEGTKRTVITGGPLPTLSGSNDMGNGEALGGGGATSTAHNGTSASSGNDPHPQYPSIDRAKEAGLLGSTDMLAEELQERYLTDRGLEEAAIEEINKDLETEDTEAEASDDDGGFEFDTPELKAEFLQSKRFKATLNEGRLAPTPAGSIVLKGPVAPKLLRRTTTPSQVSAGSSHVRASPDVSAGEATLNKSEGGLSITARLDPATSNHNTQLSNVDALLDSSSDSESDSFSEESDEEGAPMTPRTIAKMMMADVDSSPDQSKKRQKPEEPQTIIAKPNVVVTPDMTIVALGDVLNIVENTVLIKAYNSGEERIIKEGSVLCLENRVVVGAVEDNIGQVREPYYSVLFNSREEMDALGIKEGTKIFYVEKHAEYVFTQPLRTAKPYDADDKDEQMYFSSDEAQQEYERAQRKKPSPGGKAPKPINTRRAEKNAEWRRKQEESRAARGRGRDSRSHQQSDRGRFQNGRGQNRSFGQQRQEHAGRNQTQQQQQHTMQHLAHPPQNGPRRNSRNSRSTSATSLKYDDDADDDGYKPLRRPDNLYAPQQQYQYPSVQPQ
ncbi:hypothetical protein LTR60_002569, partial [Cryomyces antarcticus]